MKFTEHEMTVGIDAVARRLFAGARPPWRRRGVDAAWEALGPMEKYKRRAAAGEMVLPALQALPERPTVGARPEFADDEYAAAAEAASRALLELRTPGLWSKMPERRRRSVVRVTAALTRTAIDAMPARQEPDHVDVSDER